MMVTSIKWTKFEIFFTLNVIRKTGRQRWRRLPKSNKISRLNRRNKRSLINISLLLFLLLMTWIELLIVARGLPKIYIVHFDILLALLCHEDPTYLVGGFVSLFSCCLLPLKKEVKDGKI